MFSSRSIPDVSIPTTSESLKLPRFLINNLKKRKIETLYPSQSEIVPFLMKERYDHDVCVMSPTGTGKTLAYAIPIVKRLHNRVIPRIRAMVVVPTQDLVTQVTEVFTYLVRTTDLQVCPIGTRGFKEEQPKVIEADIIIATLGRLQAHIESTKLFTLQHLEFLVIDEADNLLKRFQPWADIIFPAIYNAQRGKMDVPIGLKAPKLDVTTVRLPHTHPKAFDNTPPLRRWLFSATLTEESTQLSQMHLQSPVFFTATSDRKYKYPENLQQYYMCVEGHVRGMALIKLIDDLIERNPSSKIACFGQSLHACHMLYLTLNLMRPQLALGEFYGSLSATQRENIVSKFHAGKINIVVCSDLMARGLDIASIDAVINYDVPEQVKVYVHRVGRTARGSNYGEAYSIVDPSEKEQFTEMVAKGDNLKLEEIPHDNSSFSPELVALFRETIPKLQEIRKEETTTGKRIKLK